MSLWVDLYGFDDDDRWGDMEFSAAAKSIIEMDTIPLKTWKFGDETFMQFHSGQYLNVAVAIVQKYIMQQFGARCVLADAEDYDWKHRFVVSFIDNR